jgi:hypothetical protein
VDSEEKIKLKEKVQSKWGPKIPTYQVKRKT